MVSPTLKQKGLLEKEFAKDGIRIVRVQSAGSNVPDREAKSSAGEAMWW